MVILNPQLWIFHLIGVLGICSLILFFAWLRNPHSPIGYLIPNWGFDISIGGYYTQSGIFSFSSLLGNTFHKRDSQNCHKATPLTSSPYQISSKEITDHHISSKAIKMSHQNFTSKFLIKISQQIVSSKCCIKMSHQTVLSKCFTKMFSSKYLMEMSHGNVSSECFIKMSHQNVLS